MTARPSRRTWALVLLALCLLAMGVVLATPLSFQPVVIGIGDWLRHDLGLEWVHYGWIEFGLNIVLFIPVGALVTLLFRRPAIGALVGVLLSIAAELAQFAIPGRLPSLRDVLGNAIGASIGALVVWWARSRGRRTR